MGLYRIGGGGAFNGITPLPNVVSNASVENPCQRRFFFVETVATAGDVFVTANKPLLAKSYGVLAH